jgi:threonine/homoserine/homoserine lactone efflux protein
MMPPDLFAFVLFAVVTSVTPGPNNVMVAASAANHGVRATVPHMLGISLGFGFMVVIVGLGLAGPLAASPALHAVLRWIGGAWMLWIAWGMIRADPAIPSGASTAAKPMGFGAAALFQWINPKAWVIAVVTSTTYTVPNQALVGQVLLLAALFILVSWPCTLCWSLLGSGAGRVLRSPTQLRGFNVTMAALLVLSVLPLLGR